MGSDYIELFVDTLDAWCNIYFTGRHDDSIFPFVRAIYLMEGVDNTEFTTIQRQLIESQLAITLNTEVL